MSNIPNLNEMLKLWTKKDLWERIQHHIKTIDTLRQQLAEKDKMHLLDEQEFQHYCAYKHIEPEIKGCLDREREYKKQLAEKNLELKKWSTQYAVAYVNRQNALIAEKVELQQQLEDKNKELEKTKQNQTQLAIQELEKVKNKCDGMYDLWLNSKYKENMYDNEDIACAFEDISVFANDLIKELKGE